ncbi:MAG: LysM peptidoglycan-binding domain-containing protein [Candidatus Roizmanbacteria bacterium]
MAKNQDPLDSLIEKVKENYVSALIGLVIVVLGIGFVANSLSTKKDGTKTTSLKEVFSNSMKKDEVKEEPKKEDSKTHTVKKGETLWSIAESYTKSGYNYVDIAKANNLKNADMLEAGQKLRIPDMKPAKVTFASKMMPKAATSKITITGTSYTVVKGDTLWSISTRAYGTGYKWMNIARANKLKNANRIEKGQKLTLPRK